MMEFEIANGYKQIRDELSKLDDTIDDDTLQSVFARAKTLTYDRPSRSVARSVQRLKRTIQKYPRLSDCKDLMQVLELLRRWEAHFKRCRNSSDGLTRQIRSINIDIENARNMFQRDVAKLDCKKISFLITQINPTVISHFH